MLADLDRDDLSVIATALYEAGAKKLHVSKLKRVISRNME